MDISISEPITLKTGTVGRVLDVPTANPVNYHEAISRPTEMETTAIKGQLFLPDVSPAPVVVIVPGSLGVGAAHLNKANILVPEGIGAFVIDPFGTRGVVSTVANQTQYSFAASAWDVLCAVKVLCGLDWVDSNRVGAQGHSRGGSAVLSAVCMAQLETVDFPHSLRGVYAAYPWCGHQFLVPNIGATKVRAVVGDLDQWCLPQQIQAHIHAMQLAGGDASCKLFAGAHHSFDWDGAVELIEDARVSPGAPTVYMANDGAFIHPLSEHPDPALSDRDLMIYGMKTGHGRTGASVGTSGSLAQRFHDDMLTFWQEVMA